MTKTAGRYLKAPRSQARRLGRGAGNPGYAGYCTWGAWNRAQWLGTGVQGDAKDWYASAMRSGLPTGTQPVVGAVFVRTSGPFGHVGIVTRVVDPTTFETEEMNGGNVLVNAREGITNEFGVYRNHVQHTGPNMKFIYKPGTQPGAYANTIVQWDADPKPQKTAWLVGPDGKRRWIPDIPTYQCLKARGVAGPAPLPADVLNQYPDLNGVWVSCSATGGIGTGTGPTAQPPPDPGPVTQTPPPPPQVTLTVYNMVTNGSTAMREDTPAYLSTLTQNFCRSNGCAIPGTERNTGGTYSPAVCQTGGARTTNGQDNSSVDDGNPSLFSSTRWYGIRQPNGSLGFISEVWINSGQRGGLGLPNC